MWHSRVLSLYMLLDTLHVSDVVRTWQHSQLCAYLHVVAFYLKTLNLNVIFLPVHTHHIKQKQEEREKWILNVMLLG